MNPFYQTDPEIANKTCPYQQQFESEGYTWPPCMEARCGLWVAGPVEGTGACAHAVQAVATIELVNDGRKPR